MKPPIDTSIIKIEIIAEDTAEITIAVPPTFTFKGGQYVTITLPDLSHEKITDQFHDFSIASGPNETSQIRIAFRKSNSIFKQTILNQGIGTKVILEGPNGVFTFPSGNNLIAIAGGIGVTPFVSMAEAGEKFELVSINTSRERAVYIDKLRKLLGSQLHEIYGEIDLRALTTLKHNFSDHLWYIAGPPGMVADIRTLLKTLMVDDTMIRTEEFSGYEKNV